MVSRSSNSGFSLVEVIVAVAVLATAVVFISRSFFSVMASTRLAQDMTRAVFLMDDKMWELEKEQQKSIPPLAKVDGTEGKFNWSYDCQDWESSGRAMYGTLVLAHMGVAWKEKEKEAQYPLDLYTYLPHG